MTPTTSKGLSAVDDLGLGDMPSMEVALRDFARVAKPGGEVRCTLPLAGTFDEFHDLYREVLIKHDKHDALDRLELHIARYPSFDQAERYLAAAGLTGGLEGGIAVDQFSLLFRSARELFFAPVIEYGPLADWKAVAGGGQDLQDVFWYIKEAIDAYFGARPFQVTVRAGLFSGRKPERPAVARADTGDAFETITTPVPLAFDTEEDSPFDHIETGLPWPPQDVAEGSLRAPDRDDPSIEELASSEYTLDEEARADQELDAFIDGRRRPHHLTD